MFLMCARVFVITLLTACLALAETNWTECKLSQGSVAFPATPVYKLSTDKSPVGTLTTHNWDYRSPEVHLTANTVKLPSVALIFAGPEDIYRDAAEALLKDSQARQLAFEPVLIGGKQGAQVSYQTASGEMGRARFLLVNDTLLTIVATWPGSSAPQSVDRFLGSLATR